MSKHEENRPNEVVTEEHHESSAQASTASSKKTKRMKRKRSVIGRFINWVLSITLILIIFVVSLLFFLVDTQAGLKTLATLANRYGSEYITIGNVEGRLGKRFSLHDVEVKVPNYPALKLPSIALEWDYLKLIDKEVDIHSLVLADADLNFTEIVKSEKTPKEQSEPFSLKDLDIPVNVSIGDIDITGSYLKIDDFYLALNNFKLEDATLIENDLKLKNAVGDFHALVGANVDVPLIVALNGDVNAPKESFDTNLAVYSQHAIVNDNEFDIALNTQLEGVIDDFDFNLDGRVDWANMLNDPILLKVQNHIAEKNEIESYLHIKNLKNQVVLNSVWFADKPYDFDLALNMDVPYLSQFHPKFRGTLMGDVILKGDIMKPLLTADVKVEGVDVFGLRLESLLLTGSHENYNANVALDMTHFKFDSIYLNSLAMNLEGNLTETFAFDLVLKDLVKEKVPENTSVSATKAKDVRLENTLDVVDTTTAQGEPDEELYFAENTPISYTPKGEVEHLIEDIEYHVKGEAESHNFTFKLDSILGGIRSEGLASLTDLTTDPTFNLYLAKSEVTSPYVGVYNLTKPAYFYFNAKKQEVTLSSVCYQQTSVVLCVQGNRSVEGVNAGVITLNNLPSSLLKEYLPDNIAIDTKANATIVGQFSTEKDFLGAVNVSLSKGDIRYQLQGRQVTVPLDKTLLEVHAQPNGITSSVNIDWGKYLRVLGDGDMKDLFAENIVNASIKADIPSFDWVSPLIPVLQGLDGEVVFASEVNGPIAHPDLGAKLSINHGKLYIASLNSQLKDINLNVDLKKGTPVFSVDGSVGTNKGTLKLAGFYNVADLSTSLNASGDNLLLADSENIVVEITPKLTFAGKGGKKPHYELKGTVLVPELKYFHSSMGGGSVITSSSDTVIVGDGKENERSEDFMNSLNMNVNVVLGEKILVGAEGLKASLSGGIKVIKDYSQPIRALGVVNVGKGQFDIYGQVLTLDRGKIQFTGGAITNPALDIQASRSFVNEMEGKEVKVGVKVLGSAQAPKVELYSSPMMQDIEIASYLFLGRSPNLESPTENLMLLNMVRKIATGEPISSSETSLASKIGLTDFGFVETPNGGTGIGLGKQFANSVYVGLGVGIDQSEGGFAILRYRFLEYFNVNSAFMSEGQSINVNYSKDF